MARPTVFEQRRRRLEFWRLLAGGFPLDVATKLAGVSADWVLDLFDDRVTREVLSSLLSWREAA